MGPSPKLKRRVKRAEKVGSEVKKGFELRTLSQKLLKAQLNKGQKVDNGPKTEL